jgi:hypothetical protein
MTTTTSPSVIAWARPWALARPFTRPTPRAGAWYPVVGEAGDERVVLEIRGRRVAVHKNMLELRTERPKVITVVARAEKEPSPAAGKAWDLGKIYGVCPECGSRIRLFGEIPMATCGECGHRGEVAWWETG